MENLTPREREVAIFNEKRDMKKALERICFDMLDIDGNGVIDIVDLMQLCSHFHAKKQKTEAEKDLTTLDIEGVP
jgi:Ca2+-binding EF-hand superfamily protein